MVEVEFSIEARDETMAAVRAAVGIQQLQPAVPAPQELQQQLPWQQQQGQQQQQ